MITDAIQQDYGGFDNRFLGVSLNFDRYRTWELFKKVSLADRDPSDVLAMGKAALADSPERAFEISAIATVLPHEMRHFHDFLLSPFGNFLYRMRLTTVLNGLQAILPAIRESKTIPVPLSTWITKNDAERATLIERWKKSNRIVNLTPQSFFQDEETLGTIARTFSRIKDFHINPEMIRGNTSFQPSYIFESSAVYVQLQNIYSVFSNEHADNFLDILYEVSNSKLYTTVLRLASKLVDRTDIKRTDRLKMMSAISTWCILGDYSTDKWNACPTIRFARLHKWLETDGFPHDKAITDLFREWTERFAYSPVEVGLQRNAAATDRLILKLEKSLNEYPLDKYPKAIRDSMSNVLNALKLLAKNSKYLSSLFINDPESYVDPRLYLENVDKWPAAPIIVNFNPGAGGRARHKR